MSDIVKLFWKREAYYARTLDLNKPAHLEYAKQVVYPGSNLGGGDEDDRDKDAVKEALFAVSDTPGPAAEEWLAEDSHTGTLIDFGDVEITDVQTPDE